MASVVPAPKLVLASASASRAGMLSRAGVAFTKDASSVDEDDVKQAMCAEGASVDDLAVTLAELKARQVGRRHPGALVVGSDQVLVCEDRWFDKPVDRAAARTQLLALRGKMHTLVSAVLVLRDGERLWHHIGRARLTVRPFTEAFLDDYLEAAGDAVLGSVGAYQLEGLGAQLFSRVDGDYFTILGMPLLPLLDFLRNHGVVKP
ncbi:MAG TPA: Maf family protein [Alphaproteobacteria bacterium]|jgi:septum formation protein